jgi:four helix bundle protein
VHIDGVQDFTKLRVWHDARALKTRVYALVRTFPAPEQFGLSDQLRRSSRSIATNIAEGFGKHTRWDCARCLQTSISEAGETLSHLYDALDLRYITREQFEDVVGELRVLRRRIGALYFKVRPAGKTRRLKPGPEARPVQRRWRGQSSRDSAG